MFDCCFLAPFFAQINILLAPLPDVLATYFPAPFRVAPGTINLLGGGPANGLVAQFKICLGFCQLDFPIGQIINRSIRRDMTFPQHYPNIALGQEGRYVGKMLHDSIKLRRLG